MGNITTTCQTAIYNPNEVITMQALERLGLKLKEQVRLDELLSENFNPRLYGLTKAQAEKVNALRDIMTAYMSIREDVTGKSIGQSQDAAEMAAARLRALNHEEIWVAYLNKDHVVLSFEMLFKGSLDAVKISQKHIIAHALSKNASNIILFHNHPLGNPAPTVSDFKQTRLVMNACKAMDMQMIDHIIITAGSYYSFADECVYKFKK